VSALTLDTAAALLVQLEPTDHEDIARLREALANLALDVQVPLAAQPSVARTARLLGELADDRATDRAATLVQAGEALEQAVTIATEAERKAQARATVATPAAAGASPLPVVEDHAAPVPLSLPTAPTEGTRVPKDGSVEEIPADGDFDLLRDFIIESSECVAHSETALLALEANPADDEAVNTVFRAFHTVKGTSAFLGLQRLADFAHEAESLLSRVRDREITYSSGCADLALRSVDMLKALLADVSRAVESDKRVVVPQGYSALIDALSGYDPALDAAPAPLASSSEGGPVARVEPSAEVRPSAAPSATADSTVRVRTDRLDRLIDLVGELVIAESMIAGDPHLAGSTGSTHHELARKVTHAGKITRELQDLAMSMRMVPLRTMFQKLTRLVRDVAVKAGKQVEFVTEGEETEIDRNMVDILGDPLVHMVRNAIDHGLETPDQREAAGKTRQGRVRLAAFNAGGNVVVELRDDGKGLDRDRIVKKAIEKGLIESEKGMADSEIFALIFAPGFSTAETVTDLSGRGVGMDVVRRNIESIRGRIDIASAPGKGTTFTIRLPLTLAVTDGMLVRVGTERFIVPTVNIHMSFRPEPAMMSTVIGRGEVVMLRGEVMPMIRLHRLFQVDGAVERPTDGLLMIVGDGEQRRSVLLVDELLGQYQVVAKTLGDWLGTIRGISGGAILGDGRVGLILDVGDVVALGQSETTVPLAPIKAAVAA
jgi:two-component system, chemotaxis family, sensor kinase CheA